MRKRWRVLRSTGVLLRFCETMSTLKFTVRGCRKANVTSKVSIEYVQTNADNDQGRPYWSCWWLYEPSESTGSEPVIYRTRSFPFLYRLPPCRHTRSKRVALFVPSRARTTTDQSYLMDVNEGRLTEREELTKKRVPKLYIQGLR